MKGVEILSQSEEILSNGWSLLFLIIIMIGIVSAMFGLMIGAYIYGDYKQRIILCLISLIMFVSAYNIKLDTYTEYQVIISDEANMKNFTDKYDIIETNGKIYTVIEKEK